jgi:hypothetical protein
MRGSAQRIYTITPLVIVILLVSVLTGCSSSSNSDTPGGSQGGGNVIAPTPNPLAAAQFPALSDDALKNLLPPLDELPAELRPDTQADYYVPDSKTTSDSLRSSWPEAADRFDRIARTYGWAEGIGVRYDTCHLKQPVVGVSIEMHQFESPAVAQAFIDDPLLHSFMRGTLFDIWPSSTVHGLEGVSLATEGDCYPQEKRIMLYFEYWGLFFSLSAGLNASADPAVGITLLNSLIPPMLARLDPMAVNPLPPTPAPASEFKLITEAIKLSDLPRLMPALDEFDESLTSTYSSNRQIGKTYTLQDFVEAYRNINLPTLADALAQAGRTYGLIGQEVRIWDTGNDCPNILGLSLEVDIALFERPAGAHDYMIDPALQQSWIGTGLMTSYVQDGDSVVMYGQIPGHRCGPVQVVGRMTPFERLLITVVVNSYNGANQQEVLDIVNIFSQQVFILLNMEKLP